MEESAFENTQCSTEFGDIMSISSNGATSRCQIVRKHGRRMFMKHIRPEFKSNKRYNEAFVKEFEIGFNLEHPNIVRFYEYGEDSDGAYMLTEYVEGMTLTELCSADPVYFKSKKNAYKLLSQLLDALHYIHSNQILHLDLKPDNLLLTNVGHDLKLIDFGFSYSDEFDTTMGHTDAFASPEQLKKLKKYDCRTDLYAVGRIVRYICEHCATEKASSLITFADRCTKENPEERFLNAVEAKEWLDNTEAKKTKAVWMAAVTFCVLMICGIAAFLMKQKPASSAITPEDREWLIAEEATERDVTHEMDSTFKALYNPMRYLWEENGVEANCRAWSKEELRMRMKEVQEFNDGLKVNVENAKYILTNRYPHYRVFIYRNYQKYIHPAEADSLKKWMDIAEDISK